MSYRCYLRVQEFASFCFVSQIWYTERYDVCHIDLILTFVIVINYYKKRQGKTLNLNLQFQDFLRYQENKVFWWRPHQILDGGYHNNFSLCATMHVFVPQCHPKLIIQLVCFYHKRFMGFYMLLTNKPVLQDSVTCIMSSGIKHGEVILNIVLPLGQNMSQMKEQLNN